MARWAMTMIVAAFQYPIAEEHFTLGDTAKVCMELVRNGRQDIPNEFLGPLAKNLYNCRL
jgi:hypothetical protein